MINVLCARLANFLKLDILPAITIAFYMNQVIYYVLQLSRPSTTAQTASCLLQAIFAHMWHPVLPSLANVNGHF